MAVKPKGKVRAHARGLCRGCYGRQHERGRPRRASQAARGPRLSVRTLRLKEQIAAVLGRAGRPMTASQIAPAVGAWQDEVYAVLRLMGRHGEVERAGAVGEGARAPVLWRLLTAPGDGAGTAVEQLIARGLTNSQIVARGVPYELVREVRQRLDRLAGAA